MRCIVKSVISDKQKIVKLILRIFSVIMFTCFIIFVIKTCKTSFDQKTYSIDNAKIIGYDTIDKQLISTTNDSQIEINNSQQYLYDLQINFEKPIEQDSIITVYYNENNGYSENDKVEMFVNKGDLTTGKIILNSNINNFRIDLGNKVGEKFSNFNIVTNNDTDIWVVKNNFLISSYSKLSILLILGIISLIVAHRFERSILFFKKAFIYFKRLDLSYKNIRLKIVFFTITVLSAFVYLIIIANNIYYNSYNKIEYNGYSYTNRPLVDIKKNDIITQTFNSKSSELSGFSLNFLTYNKHQKSNISVRLKQGNNIIQIWDLNSSEINDNCQSFILNQPLHDVLDKDFTIYIEFDKHSENAVTLRLTDQDSYSEGKASINNINTNGDLVFKTYTYIPTSTKNMLVSLIVTLILSILIIVYYYLFIRKIKIEKLAFILVLLFGVNYLILITPLSPPDEMYHYKSAYKLSNILMLDINNKDTGDSQDFNYTGYVGHYNISSGYSRIINGIFEQRQSSQQINIAEDSDSLSYPIQYLPQSVGIFFGRLLHLNFIWVFYLGRLFNLLTFAILIYFSVKIIPYLKSSVILIALLPMTLQQSASYSYDVFINGIAILLVACILDSSVKTNKMGRNEYLRILILGALLAPAKLVYSVLLLMVFIIPLKRFDNKKDYLIKIFGIFSIAVVAIALIRMPDVIRGLGNSSNQISLNQEGAHNYTISYVLNNPINTTKIFINTIYNKGLYYINTTVGQLLSGLTLPVNMFYINTFILLLIASAIKRDDYISNINIHKKVLIIASVVIIILLVMLSMFLCWTSDFRNIIEGVQGRYFIPVILPLLVVVNNKRIKISRVIDEVLIYMSVCTQFLVIFNIIGYTMCFI